MARPTFLLGVGAQKAGTSWLYSQLNSQISINMGSMKEYHVWDAKFSSLAREFIVSTERHEDHDNTLRRAMQATPGFYEKYFMQLISGEVRVTGDITPSYALLKSHDFEIIKTRLEDVGFRVKPIFIMRDPVERNWSAYKKMLERNSRNKETFHIGVKNPNFETFFRNDQRVFRTDYTGTIRALLAWAVSEETRL